MTLVYSVQRTGVEHWTVSRQRVKKDCSLSCIANAHKPSKKGIVKDAVPGAGLDKEVNKERRKGHQEKP